MNYFLIITLLVAMTIALVEDLRRQKIPNIVTFTTMALAVAYHSFSAGFVGFLHSAGGLSIGIAFFIIPYALGGMGAGDVKLMGAAGAILGPQGIIITSFLVVFAGGIYGVILYALNPKHFVSFIKRLWTTLMAFVLTRRFILMPREAEEKQLVLRYAIPISLGALSFALIKTTGYDLFPELLGDSFQILSIGTY